MNFCMEGKKVHIRGDHGLARTLVTLEALKKREGGRGSVLCTGDGKR